MQFEKSIIVMPAGMTTDVFMLRPITAADAELDFAAVMESKAFLRGWEQTGWPEDDFTVASNREDLEKLEQRNARREAFTYTVMNLDGTACLGCVYIVPTDTGQRWFARSSITPVGDRLWDDYDAAVYFWARASRLAMGTDRQLLDAFRSWFAQP